MLIVPKAIHMLIPLLTQKKFSLQPLPSSLPTHASPLYLRMVTASSTALRNYLQKRVNRAGLGLYLDMK